MKKLLLIIIFFGFLAYLFDTSDDSSEINIETKEEITQTKVQQIEVDNIDSNDATVEVKRGITTCTQDLGLLERMDSFGSLRQIPYVKNSINQGCDIIKVSWLIPTTNAPIPRYFELDLKAGYLYRMMDSYHETFNPWGTKDYELWVNFDEEDVTVLDQSWDMGEATFFLDEDAFQKRIKAYKKSSKRRNR